MMNMLCVSICLPNFNTAPFLRERLDTIRSQTHEALECIVSDNESDDGSWEDYSGICGEGCRRLEG